MYRYVSALVFCCSLFSLSTPSAASAETIIRIGGSGTGTGAMKKLASVFEKNNPGITIKVMPSLGSSGGIKALLAGALDIALSARPLKDDEKAAGAKVVFNSSTPFVLMANKSVTQKNLTTRELESILSGRQSSWSDGKPIRLVLRPEGDTDTKLIQAISPEINQAMKTALARSEKHIALTDQDADRDIDSTTGALGFSTVAQIVNEKLSARALTFNGVAPSIKNLKNRTYPLVKEQMVVLNQSKTTPEIQKFISFLKTPAAAKLLETGGIVVSSP
jgi:phosphate transport system substrate-binding protein